MIGPRPCRDKRDQAAVFRSGEWYILDENGGVTTAQWGLPGDIPVPQDYDGDGIADLAVWRPADGMWWIRYSGAKDARPEGIQWGLPGDRPIAGDFDGDGIFDYAIYRPAFGLFVYRSSSTGSVVVQQWGLPTDIPLQSGNNE